MYTPIIFVIRKCYSCQAVVKDIKDPLWQQMRSLLSLVFRRESLIAKQNLNFLTEFSVNKWFSWSRNIFYKSGRTAWWGHTTEDCRHYHKHEHLWDPAYICTFGRSRRQKWLRTGWRHTSKSTESPRIRSKTYLNLGFLWHGLLLISQLFLHIIQKLNNIIKIVSVTL